MVILSAMCFFNNDMLQLIHVQVFVSVKMKMIFDSYAGKRRLFDG